MSRDWCFIPDYIRESAKDFVKSYKKGIPEGDIKSYLSEANHILSNLLAEARMDDDENKDEDEDEDEDEDKDEENYDSETKEIIQKIEAELADARVKLSSAYEYSRRHPFPGPCSGSAEIRLNSAQNRVYNIERRLAETKMMANKDVN